MSCLLITSEKASMIDDMINKTAHEYWVKILLLFMIEFTN